MKPNDPSAASISPEAGEMPAESAGYTPDERKRLGLDIDAGKLKDALRELSHAFVEGRQGSYGMRIPAEPYRDGDLICGAAYRLICQMEESLTAAQAEIEELRYTRRWNIAQVGDVLEVCRGDHDKSAGCVPERYVREESLTACGKALREYGHHKNSCRFVSNVPNPGIRPGSCTCGLEAEMNATSAILAKETT